MTEQFLVTGPMLPSEPKTWWLGANETVWQVDTDGDLSCVTNPEVSSSAAEFAPFSQLIRKEQSRTTERRPTPKVRAVAARVRVNSDRRMGKVTPRWIIALSKSPAAR